MADNLLRGLTENSTSRSMFGWNFHSMGYGSPNPQVLTPIAGSEQEQGMERKFQFGLTTQTLPPPPPAGFPVNQLQTHCLGIPWLGRAGATQAACLLNTTWAFHGNIMTVLWGQSGWKGTLLPGDGQSERSCRLLRRKVTRGWVWAIQEVLGKESSPPNSSILLIGACLRSGDLPPAKRLGKGQVCKAEDTESWGSHKEAATPTKINLLWGRRKAPAAVQRDERGLGLAEAPASRRRTAGPGVLWPPWDPAPRGLPLHLSGGEDSAALRPCPRQVARLPPALRARCLQPPGATRAEAASAHGVMLPATTLRRIVTGRGERGERGREGSRHTQPPACQNARRRGHVPVESPRDLPRLHKAPQFGQEGRETATK
ncbi:uncharacterized protein LOC117079076 [Trachypithecus francoisi]|uniref:uncharacterized protein LOC117079076 n=1 Tax=Trachypithecus francoisi TaxID=54180 RepID=UPI00141BC49E|nr:uncharacterized protein LOC117079076 [Trachypithecus francoisi]